ncbi:MAG: protein kinase [Chloroflexi bacterium]|uniref:Protein kinase n=2 Tax=Candidatus Chlorohelix allophototropha TaxID=3003348 RepID=A0A8T7M512_9CHLR|nr:protein kinase [Chloroflexota bacterium]WJW69071.1 protein kinase [Chloroflexota bacterium L227-S17]
MGRVYVATDQNTRSDVVVKELLEEQGRPHDARQTFLDHFLNEAKVLESLKMVRSVPSLIKGVTQEGPRHYFVMEYIDGEDVSEIVTGKGLLDSRKVIEYGISVCEALEIIHARNPPIVHRDIKPDNLKIRKSDGSLALLDFGIARSVREGTNLTKGVGTKGYVAPEQKEGDAEPRSDLYSLAATMYYMLSGSVPDDPQQRMQGALRRLNPKVEVDLEEIILSNLNENPQERYNSASELSHDLKQGKMTQTIGCPNKNCLTPNNRRMIYCVKCATPLINKSRQCIKCSSFIPFRVKFCPTCGNQV